MKYRVDEIFKSLEEDMKTKILENIEKIKKNVQLKEEEIKNNLALKISSLLNNSAKEENEIYIVISPLESSILTKSYEISLMLCNEEIYLDNKPIYTYFSIPYIFEYIDEDMKYFEKLMNNNFRNITTFEIKGFRLKYEKLYMDLYLFLVFYFIKTLKDEGLFLNIKCDKISFLYGKFMENLMPIGEIKGEVKKII